MKRRFKKSASTYMLLEHSFFVPFLTVKSCELTLSGRLRQTSAPRAISSLLDRGYLEKVDEDGKYFRISKDGIECLGIEDSYFKDNTQFLKTVRDYESDKHRARYNMYSMMKGVFVSTWPKEKPDFMSFIFLAQGKKPEFENTKGYADISPDNLYKNTKGYYYEKEEIVTGFRQSGYTTETWDKTQATGVLFTAKFIYVIYARRGKSIVLNEAQERDFVKLLTDTFYKHSRQVKCIVSSRSYAIAAEMVIGYKSGRMKSVKKEDMKHEAEILDAAEKGATESELRYMWDEEEKRRLKVKSDRGKKGHLLHASISTKKAKKIDVDTLQKVLNGMHSRQAKFFTWESDLYSEIYVAPMYALQCEALRQTIGTDTQKTINEGVNWFRNMEGFSWVGSYNIVEGRHDETGSEVAYVPLIEVKTLRKLRDRQYPVSVVTYGDVALYISHCLGSRAEAFYRIYDGSEMEISSFDDYGYPIGWKTHTPPVKIIPEEDRNVYNISGKVERRYGEKIESLAAEIGLSRQQTALAMVRWVCDENMDRFRKSLGK